VTTALFGRVDHGVEQRREPRVDLGLLHQRVGLVEVGPQGVDLDAVGDLVAVVGVEVGTVDVL
jgi:hypothetical protein